MDRFEDFTSIPVGSLLDVPPERRRKYLSAIFALPTSLQDIVFQPRTGAFVRGFTKTYNVPVEKYSSIAFMILQTLIGESTVSRLSNLLSTQLQLPNDKAQAMAQEIEKELFVPVMLELNQYLAQQKAPAPPAATPSAGGARNVLDLKSQPRPPLPPPIPKR